MEEGAPETSLLELVAWGAEMVVSDIMYYSEHLEGVEGVGITVWDEMEEAMVIMAFLDMILRGVRILAVEGVEVKLIHLAALVDRAIFMCTYKLNADLEMARAPWSTLSDYVQSEYAYNVEIF